MMTSIEQLATKIQEASVKSEGKAKKADEGFSLVIKEIDELKQATIAANARNEATLGQNKKRLLKAQSTKTANEATKAELEEKLEEQERKANEAHKIYKRQRDDNAGLFSMLLATVTDGLVDSVKAVASVPAGLVTGITDMCQPLKGSEELRLAVEANLLAELESVANLLENRKDLNPEAVMRKIISLKNFESYSSTSSDGKFIFKTAKEVCKFLEKNEKTIRLTPRKDKDMIKDKIEKLVQATGKANEEKRLRKEEDHRAKMSLRETLIKTDLEKTQSAQDQYNKEVERQAAIASELRKNREEAASLMATLQNLDTTNADLSTIIEHLQKGIAYLSQVKQNWQTLVEFFSQIRLVIETHLKTQIDLFKNHATNLDCNDQMLKAAFIATGLCIQVSNCAELYTEVSKRYVVPAISGIGEQLALTKEEAQIEKQKFVSKMTSMNTDIREMIEKRRVVLRERANEQMEKYAESLTHRPIRQLSSRN